MRPRGAKDVIIHTLLFLVWFFIILSLIFTLSEACAQEIQVDINKVRYNAWEKNCSRCHGNGSEASEYGITRGTPANLFEHVGKKSTEELSKLITNGANEMPAFKGKLSKKNIELLARWVRISALLHILSQRTEDVDKLMNEEPSPGFKL